MSRWTTTTSVVHPDGASVTMSTEALEDLSTLAVVDTYARAAGCFSRVMPPA